MQSSPGPPSIVSLPSVPNMHRSFPVPPSIVAGVVIGVGPKTVNSMVSSPPPRLTLKLVIPVEGQSTMVGPTCVHGATAVAPLESVTRNRAGPVCGLTLRLFAAASPVIVIVPPADDTVDAAKAEL